MRIKQNINNNWLFTKDNVTLEEITNATFEMVNVPHTWNNLDGQDGGGDYYRATCWYKKEIEIKEEDLKKELYLEFEAVNSIADVYVNGKESAHHEGGFSTFRIHLNEHVNVGNNEIIVSADNSKNELVYPQFADFTFYGGIYRDVEFLVVNKEHFDLSYYGGCGLTYTTEVNGNDAKIHVNAYTNELSKMSHLVPHIELFDADGRLITDADGESVTLDVKDVHLWDGLEDPYLYVLKATLVENEVVLDEVSVNCGVRTFKFDPKTGFYLNGRSYPLHGVSRHQDFKGIGNAITKEQHDHDMELIKEVGANTIRLAHYQHDQYFYDLCDKEGMVVWAEIPYISEHLKNGNDNTITQMKELIIQNHHHASIVTWGVSNEITISGARLKKDMLANHHVSKKWILQDQPHWRALLCVFILIE